MLILHAIWDTQNLLLWAEDVERLPRLARKNQAKDTSHPFAMLHQELKEVLDNLLENLLVETAQAYFLQLALPSISRPHVVPVVSSQLYAQLKRDKDELPKIRPEDNTSALQISSTKTTSTLAPPADNNITLTGWNVPVLAFAPAQALDVLLKLPSELPPNISYGNSLLFWLEAAKFSLELLTQESFIPTLKTRQNLIDTNSKVTTSKNKRANSKATRAALPAPEVEYLARWQIKLADKKQENKLGFLAKAMPQSCLAFISTATGTEAQSTLAKPANTKNKPVTTASQEPVAIVKLAGGMPQPVHLLLTFLNSTLDTTLREELSHNTELTKQLANFAKANFKLNIPVSKNTPASSASKNNFLPTLVPTSTTPLVLQWLTNLFTITPQSLTGTRSELEEFGGLLYSWLSELGNTQSESTFRTCFKLDPPATATTVSSLLDTELELEHKASDYSYPQTRIARPASPKIPSITSLDAGNRNKKTAQKIDTTTPGQWRLSFYLQAVSDPSLLVGASQVWQTRSNTLRFLERTFENPQEKLLADLGRAARIFPQLEEGLKTARPGELYLTTEQAYLFLRQIAPLLEQSDFGLLLPAWWSSKSASHTKLGIKLKLRPHSKSKGEAASSLTGLAAIVEYDWQLALGDKLLTRYAESTQIGQAYLVSASCFNQNC